MKYYENSTLDYAPDDAGGMAKQTLTMAENKARKLRTKIQNPHIRTSKETLAGNQ